MDLSAIYPSKFGKNLRESKISESKDLQERLVSDINLGIWNKHGKIIEDMDSIR